MNALADAYIREDSKSYFSILSRTSYSDFDISKRNFLNKSHRDFLENKFANCTQFRGLKEYGDFLEVIREIKSGKYNYLPKEIYISGSILSKGINHNDIDLTILTDSNLEKPFIAGFTKKNSLTYFQLYFAPINYRDSNNFNSNEFIERMNNSRRIF